MLIGNKALESRLNSPNNLINRMRENGSVGKNKAMSLFGIGQTKQQPENLIPQLKFPNINKEAAINTQPLAARENVVIPEVMPAEGTTSIDDLIENNETKIKLEAIHNSALDTLTASLNEINRRLPEVNKVKDVADIAAKMNKIVTDIRADRNKNNVKDAPVHLHFYTPSQRKIDSYEEVAI